MAYLINRNPSGRIICLHALVQYINKAFGEREFKLNDMKFDENAEFNIHQTCTLLKTYPSIPFPVCPYLDNPLSKAKCYLTQSIQLDTQKSKSVSDAFNALEGLGFVERTRKGGKLTKDGIDFALLDYRTEDTLPLIRKGLLSYGPFIGLLHEFTRPRNEITRSAVTLGYPVTNETIRIKGKLIRLSTGSQRDTITRTRSVLFIWAITGGFALPNTMKKPSNPNLWHVGVLNYILSKKWTVNTFKLFFDKNYFKHKPFVDNPLSYNSMTKSTKALRERYQETERSLSLKYEHIFKNRRFAIVYLLNKCSYNNRVLNFSKLVKQLSTYPELFVINKSNFQSVLDKELPIANISGIPFVSKGNRLIPQTKLNTEKLSYGAPSNLINVLDSIFKKICD